MSASIQDAYFRHSCLEAVEAGRFPAWWADVWLSSGLARAFSTDRRWLEDLGRRIDYALRGDRWTCEDRLKHVMAWLARESRRGPHRECATFFLIEVVADMQDFASPWGLRALVPEADVARAFGVAVAVIRRARDEARQRGIELSLLEIDLQGLADFVAKDVLHGEGISVTDVLRGIREHTVAVPLVEWVEGAPTKH